MKQVQGASPIVLVHGNCSSSHFFQDFMLALAATGRYKIYAPDMRGYGDSETFPVDATRGLHDYSDDLDAFTRTLGINSFHLMDITHTRITPVEPTRKIGRLLDSIHKISA